MPKLVPHPALQPGTEVGDPSKVKTKVSPGPGGWNPALRGRILRVSGPRPRANILESEIANGPLSIYKSEHEYVKNGYMATRYSRDTGAPGITEAYTGPARV